MRKYRKFDEGGDITAKRVRLPDLDPLEEANKGENLDTTPGPKARRDSEEVMDETGTSSRFRRNLETGDLYSEEPITRAAARAMPRAAAKPTPAVAKPTPAASSADIPKAAAAAPASTGEDTSGPSNLDRILMGIPVAGAGIAGVAKLAQMRRAEKAAEMSKAAAAKFSQPQARQIATQTGVKKQPAEQIKKEPFAPAKDSSETASSRKSRNIFERTPKKSDADITREAEGSKRTGSTGAPRSRNTVGRDEEMTRRNFSSGGKVRGGGCEVRGKTRGVMR